jgi:hypothetical protein
MNEQDLRVHVMVLRNVYMQMEKPRGDFSWWLQVRLQCHKYTAERVIEWWLRPPPT